MFWTVRGKNRAINRASMDGSNVTTVISRDLIGLSCIAVDETNSRIYWTNGIKKIVETANFDGRDRKTIIKSEYPYGIDTFGDMIIWTELMFNQIMVRNIYIAQVLCFLYLFILEKTVTL